MKPVCQSFKNTPDMTEPGLALEFLVRKYLVNFDVVDQIPLTPGRVRASMLNMERMD